MKQLMTRLAWLAVMAGVLVLAACSSKSTPTLAPTATAEESSLTEETYPLPAAEQSAAELAYPIAGAGAGVVPGYPGPAAGFVPGALPYPGDGALPYPGGGNIPAQGSLPYPGSGSTQPPTGGLEPYPAPGSAPAAPTVAPPANTATPRPTRDILKELHATDPATVKLASGKIQLVEFFAFW